MKDAYADSDILIVSACRTPIGRFCGSLASVPTHELGGRAISECIKMVRKILSGRQSILCIKALPTQDWFTWLLIGVNFIGSDLLLILVLLLRELSRYYHRCAAHKCRPRSSHSCLSLLGVLEDTQLGESWLIGMPIPNCFFN